MVSRHDDAAARFECVLRERTVANISGSSFNTVSRSLDAYAHCFKNDASFLALPAAVLLPGISFSLQAMMHVHGSKFSNQLLPAIRRNAGCNIQESHRVAPARKGNNHADGIQRHQHEFRARASKQMIRRLRERTFYQSAQTLCERSTRRRRPLFLRLLWTIEKRFGFELLN